MNNDRAFNYLLVQDQTGKILIKQWVIFQFLETVSAYCSHFREKRFSQQYSSSTNCIFKCSLSQKNLFRHGKCTSIVNFSPNSITEPRIEELFLLIFLFPSSLSILPYTSLTVSMFTFSYSFSLISYPRDICPFIQMEAALKRKPEMHSAIQSKMVDVNLCFSQNNFLKRTLTLMTVGLHSCGINSGSEMRTQFY